MQNYHISLDWPQIKKITALTFLQLLKLKEIKCLYFLDWTSFEGDMSRFSLFLRVRGFPVPLGNNKITITHQDEL